MNCLNSSALQPTLNIRGQLFSLEKPCVMGILNATPDSFYEGSRVQTEEQIARRACQIVEEGGQMIDVGAFSTRPGGAEVTEEEEMRRLRRALAIVRKEQPDAIVSVDTFRPDVAKMSVEEFGADIINDVSEGGITGVAFRPLNEEQAEYPSMFRMVAQLNVPYILMSVQPTLRQMLISFAKEVQQLRDLGVKDIILDPGYGFGKTLEQNYDLLNEAEKLQILGLPILVGVSRKSMIYKKTGGDASTALNGTTILNTLSVLKGARILRVHDVKEACEVCALTPLPAAETPVYP
ncbi:MAG: dihydropteroate synthase [Prevotella sp.]|nr:MAG: dihydropteroate synthase [Prevotella sp.]